LWSEEEDVFVDVDCDDDDDDDECDSTARDAIDDNHNNCSESNKSLNGLL